MRKCSFIGCCCLSFIVYIVIVWRNHYFGYTISDSFPKPATEEPSKIYSNHLNYSNSTPTLWYNGIKIKEWNTFTKGKKFIYYDRLESLGGERLENFTEVKEIEELCLNTVGCIGYNTQGFLKTTLSPFDKWTHLEHQGGLYVLDIDYCNITKYGHECPLDSYCISISGGRYRCELKEVVDNIHVVVSIDSKGHKGLFPLLHSLKKHHTKNLHVHVVINAKQFTHANETYAERTIFCGIKPSKDYQIDTVRFTIPEQIMKLVVGLDINARYLKSTANYARFYFDQIFPSLAKIIYLDVDTILIHDIWELWKEVVSSDKLLVVAERKSGLKLSHSVKESIKDPYEARYHEKIYLNVSSFNAGVFGLNLKKWRDKKLIDEVLYWMEANAKHRFWKLGTQPLMYVVCYNEWENVDRRWNTFRLGETRKMSFSYAYILHWSGPCKPWLRNGIHVDLWNEYNHGLCSENGICLSKVEGVGGICRCRRGFKGDLCEIKVT